MTDDPWANDKLNRRADGEHLISVLLERYGARKASGIGSYILNIDAAWGEGKTFFLECLRADLEQRGHLVASVNAWRDDHADEPLITVMAAIEDALKPYLPKDSRAESAFKSAKKALGVVASETAKQVGFHLLKAATGIAVEKTLERLKEAGALSSGLDVDDKAFDKSAEHVWDKSLESLVGERAQEHRRANEGIIEFRKQTANAIESICSETGKPRPMFVFVDELDRCRPLYAIRLLEDMKHLFDVDGLVFVVATDSDQLSHSVKAVYGAEFGARKYLRRFFDRVFVFPEADRAAFLRFTFESVGLDIDTVFFETGALPPLRHIINWADNLNLSNRDIIQILDIIGSFVTSFQHKTKIEPNYLLGLATAFYRADRVLFSQLARGNLAKPSPYDEWWVTHLSGNQHSPSAEVRRSRATDFLTTLVTNSKSSLPKLMQEDTDTPYRAYFEHEYRSIHGMSYQSNTPPMSVLSEYPSRVQNAGRLIERDERTNMW